MHGQFSREWPPVLTIDSGDTVRYRTLDAGWGLEPHHASGEPRKKFSPHIEGRDDGHALCGPIAVRGAQPGMTLEVRISAIHPGTWGWSVAGGWETPLNRRLGVVERELLMRWDLDTETMVGKNQYGHQIGLRPFMGVMGMPPNEPGLHPSWPPRPCGGNIDCKELIAGSTLYLPISVPGALFSVGDGHAAQGDGEVSGTAIECPMEQVELIFHLRNDLRLTTPRAETPVGWITFGFHEDLNEATGIAVEAMIRLMEERFGLERAEALALASLIVDLRITQIVNGAQGVHAILPHDAVQTTADDKSSGTSRPLWTDDRRSSCTGQES